jgi:hypothetical protein
MNFSYRISFLKRLFVASTIPSNGKEAICTSAADFFAKMPEAVVTVGES